MSLRNLKTLRCRAKKAPEVDAGGTFTAACGSDAKNKSLIVPKESTGYDKGGWADVLCNPDVCGFVKVEE